MPKLYRPPIPIKTKCIVALKQMRIPAVDVMALLREFEGHYGALLAQLLPRLAFKLACDEKELRLDHDPPLGARPKHRSGLSNKTFYVPDANDPDHLCYRPHGPEHAGSHLIKTNVRGDRGQYPDRVLIKKQRRLESPRAKRPSRFSASRKAAKPVPTSKRRWPKRPFNRRKP